MQQSNYSGYQKSLHKKYLLMIYKESKYFFIYHHIFTNVDKSSHLHPDTNNALHPWAMYATVIFNFSTHTTSYYTCYLFWNRPDSINLTITIINRGNRICIRITIYYNGMTCLSKVEYYLGPRLRNS